MEKYMSRAKAFVFAAEEDFGITPVEAQACGTPVIAFGKGGALETIRPLGVRNPTGVFFNEQNVSSLQLAIHEFENKSDLFEPENCRNNALRFSAERFKAEMSQYVDLKWREFTANKKINY
jgi:glycosyltransferase involved in cell wall biosynthesis